MSDYGHELTFGCFLTPVAAPPMRPVELALVAERAGLDLVSFQDHPYQAAFTDTWTLMSFVAARTEWVRICGNVLNLPLRPAPLLARAAASLDLLSGGRVEMGLGAGAFWDAVVAMGGRRLAPGEAVRATEEAIAVMRGIWAVDEPGPLRVAGGFHHVDGAKRGPAPAHPIPIRIGALGPRMLRLTGRLADGWLPSLMFLPDGPASLAEMNSHIDEGAAAAGRDPREVTRYLNIAGTFTGTGKGLLDGPPAQWAEQVAEIALTHGTSGFILASDEPGALELFGREVAPRAREIVAAERTR
ncbi:LLM class flavin-dependent oxidoreductase [Pseudonocardia sp. HH130629-09]|uniref:LLM class flavin-dependent oxidoreductase n=1 Tax=Pseudonocardia sp. HH130629-09 TaxID=1641402 RepID=UPI0006CB31C6|nr:LLM class flavin-dependent oxidoreductase [Pseudonocardia sp. HH130629-09]ALE84078.1 5,10-methylene tetrahydromethanopterin reductase [Pseudonocardia sp. HH130629-09]